MTSMSATDWDDRYRGTDLVWSATPNRWVAEQTAHLTPGRALDLACGEGRNSVFLAEHGWDVTGLDFSSEAIAKSHRLAQAQQPPIDIDWRCADATGFNERGSFDLAMLVYLQLPAPQRRAAIRAAWQSLRPGGVLLVIAHHSDNLLAGVGGPQDPAVLYSQDESSPIWPLAVLTTRRNGLNASNAPSRAKTAPRWTPSSTSSKPDSPILDRN